MEQEEEGRREEVGLGTHPPPPTVPGRRERERLLHLPGSNIQHSLFP